MEKPLELTFRNMPKSDATESLVREKVEKLERICNYMTSCRVILDKPQEHQKTGNPYQVLVEVHVPPKHNLVVKREPSESNMHDPLDVVVRDAFDAMNRQLREIVEKQRDEVKSHPEQEAVAIVSELNPDQDHGFLKTVDGRTIYFHRNAVLNDDYERLEVGTGVRFFEGQGEEGPQASTVQIVDKPGA